jgi:hypothetical protein
MLMQGSCLVNPSVRVHFSCVDASTRMHAGNATLLGLSVGWHWTLAGLMVAFVLIVPENCGRG